MRGRIERAFWDGYAYSYDSLAKHFRPYQALVKEVCDCIDGLAGGEGQRILDAGCGTGNYTWELARRGYSVIGIDDSPAMLARAERKRSVSARSLEFRRHDLARPLPFSDGDFDAVICVHVLYAMRDPRALLAELHRVLKPGGAFVLVNPRQSPRPFASAAELWRKVGPSEALQSSLLLLSVGVFNIALGVLVRSGQPRYTDLESLVSRHVSDCSEESESGMLWHATTSNDRDVES